jgi:protein involved in polysaccharide export with SLBB domain
MKIIRINYFRMVFNAVFVVLGTFTLYAGDPFFTEAPAVSLATNGSQENLSALLPPSANMPASTNASSAGVTNSMMDALDDKYHLAIGDRLSFRIVEDEDDPKSLSVTDSGDLELPYIGRFPAVGKTCRELARSLKVELEKDYYYQATVIIAVDSMTKSRGIVYSVGAIRSPGPQGIPSDEVLTVSKAILRAGGFTDYADQRHVKITRKDAVAGAVNKTFTVNVKNILEKGKSDTDLTLQAGDLIYVPERLVRF